MFLMVKNLIIYLNILLCTCAPLPNNNGVTPLTKVVSTTIDIKRKVQMKIAPFEDLLSELNLVTPLSKNDILIQGKILGKVEEIVKQAVEAEAKNEVLLENQGGLKTQMDKIKLLEQKIQRITIPLSVRNKATKIENKHPEIKGTIPPEILKNLKNFEKPIIQRQYQWMELLNCNNDLYIQKLQADLNLAYSVMKSNGIKDTYEQFKLNFCYAIATVVDEVNKNIAHYEFEGMEQDLDLGISDPVINPYIAVFYNSVIARGKKNISS